MYRLFITVIIFNFILSFTFANKQDTLAINNLIQEAEKHLVEDADTAIIILKTAMAESGELNYESGYVNSGFLLSKVYKQKGLFFEAFKTIDYLLKYSENHKNKELKGKCLYTLGEINRAAFYIEKSLNFLFDALIIFKELKNTEEQAKCYNRLAAAYFEKKEMNKAELYADSSNLIAIPLNKALLISNNEEILGAVYRRTQKFKTAIQKLESALRWIRKSGDTTDVPNILNNFAYTYLEMKDFTKAIEYATRSFDISKKTDILIYSSNAAQILSDCYRASNQLEKAYNYLRYRDSLSYKSLMNDRNKIIMDLNEKYEAGKKEKERILLQNENEIKNVTIRNQQYFFLIAIVILIMVIVAAIIIYLGRRKLALANKRLEQNREKISQQHLQLSEAYNKLKELESFKDDLTSMIVHDLKNPLNAIINPPTIYQGNKLQNYIKQTSIQMLTLVSNILDIQKSDERKLNLSLDAININEVLIHNIEQIKFLCEQKNLIIENNIDKTYFIKADAEIFGRIIINLLTNAIKFSPNNGIIKINAETDSEFVKINVNDEGEGIPLNMHDIIFSKFGQVISKKSGISCSTGLGLAFCKMAVEAHGGKIGLNSEIVKGSTFWFTLPKTAKNNNTTEQKASIDYFKAESIVLTNSDYSIISLYIEQLKGLNIYEVTKIKRVLNNINESDNANIQKWKEQITQSIYSGNELQFLKLLKKSN